MLILQHPHARSSTVCGNKPKLSSPTLKPLSWDGFPNVYTTNASLPEIPFADAGGMSDDEFDGPSDTLTTLMVMKANAMKMNILYQIDLVF